MGEFVEIWENSSLDARVYDADVPPPSFDTKTLASLDTLIEASYHAASAGDVDAAAALLYTYVYRGPSALLTSILGRHEVALNALTQFFPFRDLSLDPRTTSPASRRWIMHEAAVCLHVLGRLDQAAAMASRAARAALAMDDKHSAAITYHNLAETYLANGALRSCRAVADTALGLAMESGEQEDVLVASTVLGRLADLTGQSEAAAVAYKRALRIAAADTPFPILYSRSGVRHAEYLCNAGQPAEALRIAQENYAFCAERGWQSDVALILAQISTIPSTLPEVQLEQYSSDAVDLARSLGHKVVLTDALIARGWFMNQRQGPRDAIFAASEALAIAQSSVLRLAEVDSRIQLAVARAALGDGVNAQAEAYLAAELAGELGYVRGRRAVEDETRRWSGGTTGQEPDAPAE
jgi:tetratricopeptide (TPR) repeat protein